MTSWKQNPAYELVDFLPSKKVVMARMKMSEYRTVLKEEGWKGLVVKLGPKAAVLLFLFFLGKGLVWLFVFYGGYELIINAF